MRGRRGRGWTRQVIEGAKCQTQVVPGDKFHHTFRFSESAGKCTCFGNVEKFHMSQIMFFHVSNYGDSLLPTHGR